MNSGREREKFLLLFKTTGINCEKNYSGTATTSRIYVSKGQECLMDSSWVGTEGHIKFFYTGSGDLDLWQLKIVIILYTIPGDASPRGDLIRWSNGPELNDKVHGSQRHRRRFYGGVIIVSGGSMLMNVVDSFYTQINIPVNLVHVFANFLINHVCIQFFFKLICPPPFKMNWFHHNISSYIVDKLDVVHMLLMVHVHREYWEVCRL